MRWLFGFVLAVLVTNACASIQQPDAIPPSPPDLQRDLVVPPFVEREAISAASRIVEHAEGWRAPDTVVIAVVADMNPSYGKTVYGPQVRAAARWIVDDLRPDVVLSAGDMVAGQKRGLDYDSMWRAFDHSFYDILESAGHPLWVTPGNHDGAAGAAFTNERATYQRIWEPRRPPQRLADGSNWPFYYAFERDGVLFVALDATTVGPLDPSQHRWLRRTLEANRTARATVVFGHVPPLPFAVGREWEVLAHPELESDLERYGVDVVVTGHHHAYYPGRRGSVRYIGAAALGSGPRPLIGRTTDSPRGVTVITVGGDGEIHVEARVAPEFESVIDHATLPRYIDHDGRRLDRQDVAVEQVEND